MLTGLKSVPPDTATAALTNAVFVEAYLVGANHELARELRWREFPTDQRGTYFASFWGPRDKPDIGPLHAWDDGDLGTHSDRADDRVVLIVRARYSAGTRARLSTRRPSWEERGAGRHESGLSVVPRLPRLGDDLPRLRDETREELLDWCFVVAEQPSEPRFGVDDLGDGGFAEPYVPPATDLLGEPADDWNELHWGNLFDSQARFRRGHERPRRHPSESRAPCGPGPEDHLGRKRSSGGTPDVPAAGAGRDPGETPARAGAGQWLTSPPFAPRRSRSARL